MAIGAVHPGAVCPKSARNQVVVTKRAVVTVAARAKLAYNTVSAMELVLSPAAVVGICVSVELLEVGTAQFAQAAYEATLNKRWAPNG